MSEPKIKVYDNCVNCGKEIVIETEARALTAGSVWPGRVCEDCNRERNYCYE